MKLIAIASLFVLIGTAAQAEILCTRHNGCRETGLKLRNNGGAYWHLPHKPREMTKEQMEGKAPVQTRTLRPVYY